MYVHDVGHERIGHIVAVLSIYHYQHIVHKTTSIYVYFVRWDMSVEEPAYTGKKARSLLTLQTHFGTSALYKLPVSWPYCKLVTSNLMK